MFIIKYKAFFIGLSVALVVASGFLFFTYGIKKGIDFTGGTTIEITYTNGAPSSLNTKSLEVLEVEAYQTGTSSYKFITTRQYDDIEPKLRPILTEGKYVYVETQVNTVGPTLGKEMTQKALVAIVIVILAILGFIAFAFRGISVTVPSWKYGVAAMITMAHDIIVPAGVYVLLSHFYGAEVNTLFVIALLTIMAVTISDKIVVFDRIRENLKAKKGGFDEIVGLSLHQTMVRSINTSLATVLALFALYLWGPVSTQFFALTLIVGMIVGTYSSIFVASPLLTLWNKKHK
jgi:preprotein translocase subunit SecF